MTVGSHTHDIIIKLPTFCFPAPSHLIVIPLASPIMQSVVASTTGIQLGIVFGGHGDSLRGSGEIYEED